MITTELHWATTGDVACARHAPTPGSTLYRREEWRPMTAFDFDLITAYRGSSPGCSHCAHDDGADEDAP